MGEKSLPLPLRPPQIPHGIETGPLRCQAGDWPPVSWYGLCLKGVAMGPIADLKEKAHQLSRWLRQVHKETFLSLHTNCEANTTEYSIIKRPHHHRAGWRTLVACCTLNTVLYWFVSVHSLQIRLYRLLYCVIWGQLQHCWSDYEAVLIGILLLMFRSIFMPPSSGCASELFKFYN